MSERKIITEGQFIEFLHDYRDLNVDGRERELAVEWFAKREPAPRPRQEIIDYIKAITHQPCSCTHCQTRKQILLWAFPGIEKELEK